MTDPAPTSSLRVTVIGGAGDMGRHAVRALVRLGTAADIVVADIDEAKATRLADEVGAPVRALQLDVTDEAGLHAALEETDVVLNTMGPFATFATPILTAAIDTGCDYLDIDDDWESTLEAFELDEAARKAGVRVVVGLGASPGVTNLCARLAAGRLDTVEDLFTGWSLSAAVVEPEEAFPSHGSAAGRHWIHQCTGTIRTWEGGGLVDSRPMRRIDFTAPGLGESYAFTMGHPEPITLGPTFEVRDRCLNLQSAPAEIFAQLTELVGAVEAGQVSVDDAVRALEERPESVADDPLPHLYALARGTAQGQPRTVLVHPTVELPGQMGGATGIPLAVGVELLRRGRIAAPGVHAPETALDAHDFFDVYATFADAAGADVVAVREG